jgi:hypothetical protein
MKEFTKDQIAAVRWSWAAPARESTALASANANCGLRNVEVSPLRLPETSGLGLLALEPLNPEPLNPEP